MASALMDVVLDLGLDLDHASDEAAGARTHTIPLGGTRTHHPTGSSSKTVVQHQQQQPSAIPTSSPLATSPPQSSWKS